MDDIGILLGGLICLGVFSELVMKRFDGSGRQFPWCRTCGKNMISAELPSILPEAVRKYLDRYGLPTFAVSKYVCPKGDYQLWFIPKFYNTEKAFFLKEEL